VSYVRDNETPGADPKINEVKSGKAEFEAGVGISPLSPQFMGNIPDNIYFKDAPTATALRKAKRRLAPFAALCQGIERQGAVRCKMGCVRV
jgi:hypothetical protein